MDQESLSQHLAHIETLWSVVAQAHAATSQRARPAQELLLRRYSGAVHRYLLGALRDPNAADELFQEFALRFVRGDFQNANPARGRFRSFVKTVLFHLIVDYQRKKPTRPAQLDLEVKEPAVFDPSLPDSDRKFVDDWRQELLDRTWLLLEEFERDTGQPYHTILRCRADQPLLASAELAEQLGAKLGKSFTVDGVRKALQRAREKFADQLLEEVARSLEDPSAEELEQELIDLGLLSYCRAALDRWNRR